MNKAIVVDLDGTLLNKKSVITQETIDVIEQAKKYYSIYIATGKSPDVAIKYHEQLGLKTKMICSQGIEIYSPEKGVQLNSAMNLSDFEILFENEFLEVKNPFFYLKDGEKVFTSDSCGEYDDGVVKMLGNGVDGDILSMDKNGQVTQFYLSIDVSDIELKETVEYLTDIYPDMSVTYWNTPYQRKTISLKPLSINKWTALQKIFEDDGITHITSFGDGQADFELLKNSDLSFAMRNGVELIRAISTNVTNKTNDENGVAFELIKLLNN